VIQQNFLITLAIKLVHNLQPHLSYVSALPEIAQNSKRDTDDLIDIETVFLRASSTKSPTSGKHDTAVCMCKGKVMSLQTPTQPALFRATSNTPNPVLFRTTHTIK